MKYMTPLYFDKIMNIFRFIFEKSAYDPDYDLFRIKDITDSFSTGQIACKEWLSRELKPFYEDNHNSILIIGSWYGLMSHILVEDGWDKEIINFELDDVCIKIAKKLRVHSNIKYEDAMDGLELFEDKKRNHEKKIVICTACEHIDHEDLFSVLSMKNENMIVALQSNNMVDVDSHINCHTSVDHFIETLPKMKILYKGTLKIGEWDRYMVIAR